MIDIFYQLQKDKFLHKISFSEGIRFNYVEIVTNTKIETLSTNKFIIDESIDMQNSEYQYKFACHDREGVEEVKKVLGSIDKAKIVNLGAKPPGHLEKIYQRSCNM